MTKQKEISTLTGSIIIIVAALVFFGGVFIFQHILLQRNQQVSATKVTNINDAWKNYINKEYGFGITFPDSWKGYAVATGSWSGWKNAENGTVGDYTGIELIFKNPQTTSHQSWQDIPIMVFTPEVWQLIQQEKVGVSAAPIPPEEVGENSKYIFATPPRWYGFTDAIGFQEAVEIVKTFKAFN
jgi:hypothetical protein